ncbi:hypothetical protein MKW98_003857 [Papaver atlanticum]|uniref:Neprosin PEP catalytic domain-containing protein n=1 Tax=Papaver atlanticum TaxID=357466 RepID=A0AAD4TAE9_9MAGN|nr:hypothetical protein MKW98_003857 [Papaver atlanticum]
MEGCKSNLMREMMLIVLCFCFMSNYAAGESDISKKEDVEISRLLKILNKPPVKTFTTKYGDIIDCIDIFKQPAFDHPLLKDHKIEVKPTFPREGMGSFTTPDNPWSEIERRKERCPLGAVPIRRTTKQELIFGSKYHWEKTKQRNSNTYPHTPMYHHFASIQPVEGKSYYGGHVIMGVHNPLVTPEQFSTSQMWIQNGPEEQINSIEAGLAVYPKLFGDNITRIFGYWTADGYKSTGCFNIFCPGFVQVHPSITFGELLEPVSVYKGKKYSIPVEVYKARASGNWLLSVGEQVIGYWPKELFTHLAHNASIIRYGGIAGALSGSPSPPMGNGHFPEYRDYDLAKAGFMREMKVFNEAGEIVYFDFTKAPRKLDTKKDNCYKLYYYSYISKPYTWNIITYGGPGGSSCP